MLSDSEVDLEVGAYELRLAVLADWRDLYKVLPPFKVRSGFLRRAIAYRLQEVLYVGLEPFTKRELRRGSRSLDGHHDPQCRATRVRLGLSADAIPGTNYPIDAALSFRKRGIQMKLAVGGRRGATATDPTLVTAVARAFDWLIAFSSGRALSIADLARRVRCWLCQTLLQIAFLSPNVMGDTIAGRQPTGMTADKLIWRDDVPPLWSGAS